MFKLQVVEAKRNFFPVPKKNKQGQVIIDPETGKPMMKSMPGGYTIRFNDGTKVSVTKGKVVVGQTDDRTDIVAKEFKFSVTQPGAPITDHFGRPTGQFLPDKQVFPASSWDVFNRNYGRTMMPQLVQVGMTLADEAMKQAA